MRIRFAFLVCLLASCAAAPPVLEVVPPSIFDDTAFAPNQDTIAVDQVFALSAPMQRYLDERIRPRAKGQGAPRALYDALYGSGELQLVYDGVPTRTAAEAFDARIGNCLSLAIMTAAFAKGMGIPVQFRSININETMSRSNGLVFLSGHVNVAFPVTPNAGDVESISVDAQMLAIDFAPQSGSGRRLVVIDERTLLALYLNNRAAELLAEDELDRAYWWIRTGIELRPHLLLSYNTLGVIYGRKGQPQAAERVYRHILAREPDNTSALTNLALLLKKSGREAEAGEVGARLRALQPFPPFHFLDRGIEALAQSRFTDARDAFQRELRRSGTSPEAHSWMASALIALGEDAAARKHLRLAIEYSVDPQETVSYQQQLDALESRRARRR